MSYSEIKRLSKELGRPTETLLALSINNDPFYAAIPNRRKLAEWFAGLWEQFGFGGGVHVRRIHYRIISQPSPILLPSGEPYRNTIYAFRQLIWGARDARYLGLVPGENFIDQRNNATVIRLRDEAAKPANLLFDEEECDDLTMPDAPRLDLSRPTISQPYHIEIIAEKTTADDVLDPIAGTYQLNYTSCAGEISLTRCFEIVQRAVASQRPVRILYVSDFDPGGQSMPVAAARKLEFLIRDGNLHLDLQLRPVVLNEDQCAEYQLPRTPLKDSESRAADFQARFGEGATELDALEALRPGELRRILVEEIERYYDTSLARNINEAARGVEEEIEDINDTVEAEFEFEHEKLSSELADLSNRISLYRERANQRLSELAPYIDEIEWPEPSEADEDPDPLFDSQRDYVEQIDRYKEFQDRPTEGKRKAAA